MPIHFWIDSEHRAIVTVFEGLVSDAELIEHQQVVSKDPQFRPGYHQLADVRKLDASRITSEGVRTIAERDPSNPEARIAIVVASDEIFGLARMFQMLRDEEPKEIRVFRDVKQALEWLGIPPHIELYERLGPDQS